MATYKGLRPTSTDSTNSQAWVVSWDPASPTTDIIDGSTDVSPTTGQITATSHPFNTDDRVFLVPGVVANIDVSISFESILPTGFYYGILYYVNSVNANTFTLRYQKGGDDVVPTAIGSGDFLVVKATELVPSRWKEGGQHEWGYPGAWPMGLAYDLLADARGNGSPTLGDYTAIKSLAATFHDEVVAYLPHDHWQLSRTEVQAWISSNTTPVAEFAASRREITAGGTVTFTNLSSGYNLSYLWDFGNGTTSTSESPTATYAAAGTFTVRLAVYQTDLPSRSFYEEKTAYIKVT
ncbi:MAG: PKD domain-containing protein [Candidatus Nanopelagicaceae bacterium]